MHKIRIGHGYDVHRLVEDRKLILGGVEIPFERGLLGHSDADVLLHAISDALLGAVALGDIGKHVPDTDPAYKGADSLELARHVARLMAQQGWKIETIDSTINAYPDMFLNQNERTAFRRACRIQNQFPYRLFCRQSLHSPGAAVPDTRYFPK